MARVGFCSADGLLTLREAMLEVLREAGHSLRSRAIADEISRRDLYRRRDGSDPPPGDVNVLANDTKSTFRVDRGLISLVEWEQGALSPALRASTSPPIPVEPPPGLSAEIAGTFFRAEMDLSERPGAPAPGWMGVPEIAVADRLRADGVTGSDVRLFLTFTAAMDRARDADQLWLAAERLRADAPWTFDPGAVVAARLVDLMDELRRHGVSRKHGLDGGAWRRLAESLVDAAVAPEVRRAVYEGVGDAARLLRELESVSSAGTDRFPFLRGPKVGPMWVRMLAYPGGAAIRNMEIVPVAVDVQVRRVTENLGVTRTRALKLDEARPVVQSAWHADVEEHGAPGPPGLVNTAAALDPALWFWGKWGCTLCERVGAKRPVGPACRRCNLVASDGPLRSHN